MEQDIRQQWAARHGTPIVSRLIFHTVYSLIVLRQEIRAILIIVVALQTTMQNKT